MIRTLLAAAAALVLGACAPPEDQETGSITPEQMRRAQAKIDPAAAARIDSANAAFRRDDFTAASRLYREAAGIDRDAAAAWFGIYMAETALGNAAAADSALDRARKLQPGASLLRVGPGEGPDTSAGGRR